MIDTISTQITLVDKQHLRELFSAGQFDLLRQKCLAIVNLFLQNIQQQEKIQGSIPHRNVYKMASKVLKALEQPQLKIAADKNRIRLTFAKYVEPKLSQRFIVKTIQQRNRQALKEIKRSLGQMIRKDVGCLDIAAQKLATQAIKKISNTFSLWVEQKKFEEEFKLMPLAVFDLPSCPKISMKGFRSAESVYKIIFATHKVIGQGSYHTAKSTIELDIDTSKNFMDRMALRAGIKRKRIGLYSYEEVEQQQAKIERQRQLLQGIAGVQIPKKLMLKYLEGRTVQEKSGYKAYAYYTYYGEPITDAHERTMALKEQEVRALLLQLSTVLLALRKDNKPENVIIHGDIKLENILLQRNTNKGSIISTLIDFDGAVKGKRPQIHTRYTCSFDFVHYSLLYAQDFSAFDVNHDIFSLAICLAMLSDSMLAAKIWSWMELLNLPAPKQEEFFWPATRKKEYMLKKLEQHASKSLYKDFLSEALKLNCSDVTAGTDLLLRMQQKANFEEGSGHF